VDAVIIIDYYGLVLIIDPSMTHTDDNHAVSHGFYHRSFIAS